MLLADLEQLLRSQGIPLGGILLGLALGGGLFATAEWLRHRPARSSVGTVRIERVAEPAAAGDAPPGGRPPDRRPVVPAEVSTADGTRTVLLRGAGASPNAPLPRARRFLAVLAGSFAALSSFQLAF